MGGIEELFERAKAARSRAYAPYSRFPVGAALRAANGAVFSGCNVENAAFPLGLCAEASAISAMIAGGETRIADILVLGPGPGRITPCGACRQRIAEFCRDDTLVHLADEAGAVESVALADLLPRAFGAAALGSSLIEGEPG
jgi:cytidine deaminase